MISFCFASGLNNIHSVIEPCIFKDLQCLMRQDLCLYESYFLFRDCVMYWVIFHFCGHAKNFFGLVKLIASGQMNENKYSL